MIRQMKKKNHMNQKDAEELVAQLSKQGGGKGNAGLLGAGNKVMLDYEKLSGEENWKTANPEYKAWVEAHKNEILTIGYNSLESDNPWSGEKGSLITFQEDHSDPPKIFMSSYVVPVSQANKVNKNKVQFEKGVLENQQKIEDTIKALENS